MSQLLYCVRHVFQLTWCSSKAVQHTSSSYCSIGGRDCRGIFPFFLGHHQHTACQRQFTATLP